MLSDLRVMVIKEVGARLGLKRSSPQEQVIQAWGVKFLLAV